MNEAAERAMPQARELFLSAIRQMTLEDAREILFGGQKDAATRYLRQTMGKILEERITPVVRNTLASTGAIQIYDRVTAQYAAFDFVTGAKTGLERYVTEKTLDGVFHYIAKEEEAIRANPAKRTSEILRLVFGNTAER